MSEFLVDVFTTAPARAEFEDRRQAIIETAAVAGLTPENAIFIGGAALAMRGIDTSATTSFDVDWIRIGSRQRQGLVALFNSFAAPEQGVDWHAPGAPLPFSEVRDDAGYTLMRYWTYKGMVNDAEVIDGLAVLPTRRLVAAKVRMSRDKDVAGLLKAHVIARAKGHPIAADRHWRRSVRSVIRTSRDLAAGKVPGRRPIPADWVAELVDRSFDHPAFAGLRR